MSMIKVQGMTLSILFRIAVAAAAILLFLTPIQAIAEDKIVTQATLIDRIQIEDMIVRYYFDLPLGKSHDLAQYYTEDAVLDLGGILIAEGREAIEKLYANDTPDAKPGSREHVLLNNPIISVDGDTATAWCIWTEIMNDDITKPPRLFKQGREYDELVKINGRWYFKKRYITSDSAMDEKDAENYKPRQFR